ncbi:dihydrofolate reductase [Schaalia sp. lx-100]|nr:dihydrofolate reductase [Schaalia sp. lx-260]MCD4558134.1 dihydrofolate reductase [Schaalia sp. lx-100]
MLWHVPADFAHFKKETLGCPILMGRASWEALGAALPGRLNVVVTRNTSYKADGALVVSSLSEALDVCHSWAKEHGADTVWVTGGGLIYQEAMSFVDELVVTDLDFTVSHEPTDPLVYAPVIDPLVWTVDPQRSDTSWRPCSGDAQWKVTTYFRK